MEVSTRKSRNTLDPKLIGYLSGFALIVIPVYTYLFATKESPFDYTMSMIGNLLGFRTGFIIWGIVTGLLLTFFVGHLFWVKSFEHPRAKRLLVWSLVFLILCVTIPALDAFPFWKKIHGLTAVAFALCLLSSIYLFIKYLEEVNKRIAGISIKLMIMVVGGSLLMLFLFGMTGIFEIFFFTSLSLFLGILRYFLKRSSNESSVWE